MGHWHKDILFVGFGGIRYVADKYVPDNKEKDQSTTILRKRELAPGEVWPPLQIQTQRAEEPPRSTNVNEILRLENLRPSEQRILANGLQERARSGGFGNQAQAVPPPEAAPRKRLEKSQVVKGEDGRFYRADYEDEL
jgi:hypothetical protein